jgi:hypothetical protein
VDQVGISKLVPRTGHVSFDYNVKQKDRLSAVPPTLIGHFRITSGRCDGHNSTSNVYNADIRNTPAAAHRRSLAHTRILDLNTHY